MSVGGSQLALGAQGHVVQFYGDDNALAESACGYLEAGLRAGHSALVVATAKHRFRFMSKLVASGLDTGAVERAGRLLAVDAAETLASFTSGDRIDPERFESVVSELLGAVAAFRQPVRIYAEMVALLWDDGRVPLALELEGLWNQLRSRLPFSLLCGYPARLLGTAETAQAVDAVCRLHGAVLGFRPVAAPAGTDVAIVVGERSFPESRVAPREARHFVLSTLGSLGDDPALAADAAIVASELAANAVLHARSGFTIAVSRSEGGIRISVADGTPLPAVNGANPLPARDGHGLGVVATIASSWSAEPHPDGKVVWAELPLSASSGTS